jgi:conjugal transfer pilus assembly protein TraV
MKRIGLWGALALALAGCAGTLSGLDGRGRFSCQAPDGIACASLSGVYANALQNHLPGQARSFDAVSSDRSSASMLRAVPRSGEPIRSAQKVRRVWLAPWEDDDEVLHDQSYLYLIVDPGRWQVEHARRQAGEGYRPVLPPSAFTPSAPAPGERPALRMDRTNPAPPMLPPLSGRDPLPPVAEGEP